MEATRYDYLLTALGFTAAQVNLWYSLLLLLNFCLFFTRLIMLFIQQIYSCVFLVTMCPPIVLLNVSWYKLHTTHNSSICSEKGLMLKTLAFETPYGGQIPLSPQLITKFSCNGPGHWCCTTVQKLTPFFELFFLIKKIT